MRSTIDAATLRQIANEACAAFSGGGRQVRPFSAMYPALTLDDAYQVTALANGLRLAQGHKPVDRKIGFTNSRLWDEYGVRAPIWGYVYDRTLHDLGAPFSLAPLAEPRIEPEIMLGLAKTPSPGMDDAALLSCVALGRARLRNRAVDLPRLEIHAGR
jgi:2-oxo-3-hexenedioate decarboxylase